MSAPAASTALPSHLSHLVNGVPRSPFRDIENLLEEASVPATVAKPQQASRRRLRRRADKENHSMDIEHASGEAGPSTRRIQGHDRRRKRKSSAKRLPPNSQLAESTNTLSPHRSERLATEPISCPTHAGSSDEDGHVADVEASLHDDDADTTRRPRLYFQEGELVRVCTLGPQRRPTWQYGRIAPFDVHPVSAFACEEVEVGRIFYGYQVLSAADGAPLGYFSAAFGELVSAIL
ncbi:hypothetical protein OH77DRAFT_1105333 [Trametes cingulata]|nr:hypothetical protein OH77DRAFT_1105333 [Trametes cingulata]